MTRRTATGSHRFNDAIEHLEHGIGDGTHLGAQLYVSVGGQTVVDVALGEAEPGRPLGVDTLMLWFSATKIFTAIATMQFLERGLIELDMPVAERWPAFGQNGKREVTVRHLLTHTSGIEPVPPPLGFATEWPDLVLMVERRGMEPGWDPERNARYGPVNTFALGGLIEAVTGEHYPEWIRRAVLEPIGVNDTHLGIRRAERQRLAHRWAPMFDTTGEHPVRLDAFEADEVIERFHPAGGGRGPARDLGKVYEALLEALDGRHEILQAPTVEIMSAPHRTGMTDLTFGAAVAWGLGVVVADGPPPRPEVPYGFGRFASARTFGHGGFRSTQALADPDHRLVVVLTCNGLPADDRHERRVATVLDSIYSRLVPTPPLADPAP